MAQTAQPTVYPPVRRSISEKTEGHKTAPIWPNDSTPPVTEPARPIGARRADSDSRMPCQDIAVALSMPATTPIATADHASLNLPVSTTLPAIPNASHDMTKRGAT